MTKSKTGSSRSPGGAVATRAKSGSKSGGSKSDESFNDTVTDVEANCKLCLKQYVEKRTKMMKCDRCHGNFCIGCLDFDTRKFEILSESDSMWFCSPCRVTVEKSILTDRKIEERCREIMEEYEGRIEKLERLLKVHCENEISELSDRIKEEVKVQMKSRDSQPNTDIIASEIRERKERENNIVLFGVPEQSGNDSRKRMEGDTTLVKDLLEVCNIRESNRVNLKKVIRLGKTPGANEIRERSRPILVCLDSPSTKKTIFKNIRNLKDNQTFSSVQIRNDLTKCERERERKLNEEAKTKENEETENHIYRVRGPPWSRKIVRFPKTPSH